MDAKLTTRGPMQIHQFKDPAVKAAFDAFPEGQRQDLLKLRDLIFHTHAETPEAGDLIETLKWGQPSYLTEKPKSGSTIRLGLPKTGGFAIYTHCQTTLISDFRVLFPDDFTYEGNRAVHFADGEAPDADKLVFLIRNALTYHLKK